MEIFSFTAAMALGVIFLASGSTKMRDPRGFLLAVLEYDVLPRPLAVLYGYLLPVAEIACGLALVLGFLRLFAGVVSVALLVSFLVGVTVNLARGRTLDCHCFGSRGGEPLSWVTVARLCVLAGCGAVIIASRPTMTFVPPPSDTLPALLVALALLLGLYLLRAAPAQWPVWRTKVAAGTRLYGGCVSYRHDPARHTSDALGGATAPDPQLTGGSL